MGLLSLWLFTCTQTDVWCLWRCKFLAFISHLHPRSNSDKFILTYFTGVGIPVSSLLERFTKYREYSSISSISVLPQSSGPFPFPFWRFVLQKTSPVALSYSWSYSSASSPDTFSKFNAAYPFVTVTAGGPSAFCNSQVGLRLNYLHLQLHRTHLRPSLLFLGSYGKKKSLPILLSRSKASI